MKADEALGRLGLSSSVTGPEPSEQRFPDGAHFRVEIPSVENLRVLQAVLEAARQHEIVVNRVSQGSHYRENGAGDVSSPRRKRATLL